jgi:hypothetical protein
VRDGVADEAAGRAAGGWGRRPDGDGIAGR